MPFLLVQCSNCMQLYPADANLARSTRWMAAVQVGRSLLTVREIVMLTSVRSLLAATVLAGSVLASAPAFADDTAPPSDITVTGNVALTTDYRFRGVSLSGGDPA